MKCFHVHLHVDDLGKSIGFYSRLFAAEPARIEDDCAKWMPEDPPVNFAISTRGAQSGVDHLGIQTDAAAACCTPETPKLAKAPSGRRVGIAVSPSSSCC